MRQKCAGSSSQTRIPNMSGQYLHSEELAWVRVVCALRLASAQADSSLTIRIFLSDVQPRYTASITAGAVPDLAPQRERSLGLVRALREQPVRLQEQARAQDVRNHHPSQVSGVFVVLIA